MDSSMTQVASATTSVMCGPRWSAENFSRKISRECSRMYSQSSDERLSLGAVEEAAGKLGIPGGAGFEEPLQAGQRQESQTQGLSNRRGGRQSLKNDPASEESCQTRVRLLSAGIVSSGRLCPPETARIGKASEQRHPPVPAPPVRMTAEATRAAACTTKTV